MVFLNIKLILIRKHFITNFYESFIN